MKVDIDPFPPMHDWNIISDDFESLINSFKYDENSKFNVYQCVNVQGKQSLHLTQGMKRLKINERSSMQVNKYGSHGKENFFQGKNVYTNKGNAKMVEQPRPTNYKEALQRHNSFSNDQVFNSDEDDCLCESCSCIVAWVFGKVAVGINPPLSDIDSGPIVEPKKVESVFSRAERPKQLRTFKPRVGEPNKCTPWNLLVINHHKSIILNMDIISTND